MGVSQNEAAGTGSLSQGSVSRVCFVVCFGGLFRTVLLPRTFKFKGSVSGSVSKVGFGVCFGGLFRQSRTSQPYLKLHSPKKCKPIYIYYIWFRVPCCHPPPPPIPHTFCTRHCSETYISILLHARRCSETHIFILLDEPSRRIRWVDRAKLWRNANFKLQELLRAVHRTLQCSANGIIYIYISMYIHIHKHQ